MQEDSVQRAGVTLVTGGARSGKSSYAERRVARHPEVLYIATAQASDAEMRERIAHHRAHRPANWTTWERHRGFDALAQAGSPFNPAVHRSILLDCLGNLLMGIMFDELSDTDTCPSADFEHLEALAVRELDHLLGFVRARRLQLIVVTNEIGLGLVPADRMSRFYRDILGRLNSRLAADADEVVFLVSGIALVLKAEKPEKHEGDPPVDACLLNEKGRPEKASSEGGPSS
jgi:adenosylcobinamide kinase/adenosylcobinamide-phosphate guanylyltransferase